MQHLFLLHVDRRDESNPFCAKRTTAGLAYDTKEIFSEHSRRGESLACANQLVGNSFRQSVMYFPQNGPRRHSGYRPAQLRQIARLVL